MASSKHTIQAIRMAKSEGTTDEIFDYLMNLDDADLFTVCADLWKTHAPTTYSKGHAASTAAQRAVTVAARMSSGVVSNADVLN